MLLLISGAVGSVRHFLYELFWIPSGSMEPAVLARELVVVSKSSELELGQIAVFRSPVDPNMSLLKRVVALGGDHLVIDPELGLILNGEPKTQATDSGAQEVWLGNRISLRWAPPYGQWEIRVPEGHFVVLGDNRQSSIDSRQWGAVPERNHQGRAELVVWSCRGNGVFPGCGLFQLRPERLLESLAEGG